MPGHHERHWRKFDGITVSHAHESSECSSTVQFFCSPVVHPFPLVLWGTTPFRESLPTLPWVMSAVRTSSGLANARRLEANRRTIVNTLTEWAFDRLLTIEILAMVLPPLTSFQLKARIQEFFALEFLVV